MTRTERDIAAKQHTLVPGVIDTIADGLSLALARPLLLLVPVLLDLYYWIGWKISIAALTDPIRNWTLRSNAEGASDVANQLSKIGNADISWLFSLFVPSLLSNMSHSDLFRIGSRPELVPNTWWVDVPLLALAILGATFLLMLYAVPLADAALNRGRSRRESCKAIAIASWRLIGLLAICLGIALLLLVPFTVASAGLWVVGVNAAPMFGSLALLGAFLAYVMLWFAPDAIVVSQVGPFRAIRYSIMMLRSFFWQTAGLGAASFLMTAGMGELWDRIVDSAPGLLLGVIANAFFATGLAIASMMFYARRIQLLKPDSL